MLERNLRRAVVRLLRPLHAISVENGLCCPGTPDVNFAWGWIELKSTNAWPVRADTPVRLDHPLTPQQRIWIRNRCATGGNVWILLTVASEWLLFRGEKAEVVGVASKEELRRAALATWQKTPSREELIECLRLSRHKN